MKDSLFLMMLLALVAISGCSATRVHLHADSLPSTEREGLRTALEAQGFEVKMRDNESPSSGNIILYYPHKGIGEDLQAIDAVLAAHGLTAEHSYTIHKDKLGVHEYTAGNIGVYLVAEDYTPVADFSLVRSVFPITMTQGEFISADCDTEYLYEFSDDGRMVIADLSLSAGDMNIATLTWEASGDDRVLITSNGEVFEYQKSNSHKEGFRDGYNKVVDYYITLKPVDYYRLPFGCTYKNVFREGF